VTSFATPEGTKRYAARFAGRAAEGHFREREGLSLSSLGIGTYLGHTDPQTDAAYTSAAIAAVEGGANVIDTAINYRLQRSERSIREALAGLARRGFAREEIILCTKGGYLSPDGEMPADPAAYFEREYLARGILRREDIAAGCHAMSPTFLEDQIGRSLRNLGVDCIDVYYLHNPETQLGEVPRTEFLARVRAAFTFLESAAAAGKIQYYGIATWNGFRQPATAGDALQLGEMATIAREIAGEAHRFRFIQLPFNLGMTEALTLGSQHLASGEKTIMEAAEALGITLIASASLLQGQVTRNLPSFVSDALGLENDAERALQFARSAPGITTALVGMSRAEHARANARLASVPPATVDQFSRLFSRDNSGG
jgi:aryl-alcohol dehydrogenase-like predicted oxidoreductase